MDQLVGPGVGIIEQVAADAVNPSQLYSRFCRGAAFAFALVAVYTVVVKAPTGGMERDWMHTALHILTGAVAAYAGWISADLAAARLFAVAIVIRVWSAWSRRLVHRRPVPRLQRSHSARRPRQRLPSSPRRRRRQRHSPQPRLAGDGQLMVSPQPAPCPGWMRQRIRRRRRGRACPERADQHEFEEGRRAGVVQS